MKDYWSGREPGAMVLSRIGRSLGSTLEGGVTGVGLTGVKSPPGFTPPPPEPPEPPPGLLPPPQGLEAVPPPAGYVVGGVQPPFGLSLGRQTPRPFAPSRRLD